MQISNENKWPFNYCFTCNISYISSICKNNSMWNCGLAFAYMGNKLTLLSFGYWYMRNSKIINQSGLYAASLFCCSVGIGIGKTNLYTLLSLIYYVAFG